MMHQIRKMVSMVALVVRCGCDVNRILESYDNNRISIPKAPGLGLLLERPVFDTHNERAVSKWGKEKIDFGKYEKEMEEFKQREIYERIFREEEKDNQYVRRVIAALHFVADTVFADSTLSSRLSTHSRMTSSSTSPPPESSLPKVQRPVKSREGILYLRLLTPSPMKTLDRGKADRTVYRRKKNFAHAFAQ